MTGGAPWYGGHHIGFRYSRYAVQISARAKTLFIKLFILYSLIQYSFLYRQTMITCNEIMCGRGACACAKDDAKEEIIVTKFEFLHSRQYAEGTSRGWLKVRMVSFKLTI